MTAIVHSLTARAASPLLAIAPGPTRVEVSSAGKAWAGVLLERHITSPGERLSASFDGHVISMLNGPWSRFEYRDEFGRFVPCINRPGTITITPAGPVPDLRLHTQAELVHCALDERFVRGVVEEMDAGRALHPAFRPAIQDEAIRGILGMLMMELEGEAPCGRLYVDSLAHALATRYLLLDRLPGPMTPSSVSGLPSRILNRIRAKIEDNIEADLTLDSLAEESGYSRAHFLRMFRAATGVTPHQYVLDLRLNRAQDCLRKKNVSMIDVALSCGFSSQSHMTSVFRQRLEMTPGEFRRSVRSERAA
jgi:AraC family transcriptional regulator